MLSFTFSKTCLRVPVEVDLLRYLQHKTCPHSMTPTTSLFLLLTIAPPSFQTQQVDLTQKLPYFPLSPCLFQCLFALVNAHQMLSHVTIQLFIYLRMPNFTHFFEGPICFRNSINSRQRRGFYTNDGQTMLWRPNMAHCQPLQIKFYLEHSHTL